MDLKTIFHGGKITQTKQAERNGVPVGIVEGYIATWDIDRGDWSGLKDRFLRGAFTASLERHRKTDRPVRLKDQHSRTIGGFPIAKVFEDDRGLFGSGEINLDVQQGREAFALAKQGVISDFSIGWENKTSVIVDGIREISEAEVWEGSLVDEPMNPFANITAVKSIDFADIDVHDIRAIEAALKNGIRFSNKTSKTIISLMKNAGLLRDEHDGRRDGDLMARADQILNTLRGF